MFDSPKAGSKQDGAGMVVTEIEQTHTHTHTHTHTMIKDGDMDRDPRVQWNSSCWTKMEQFKEQNTKSHSGL